MTPGDLAGYREQAREAKERAPLVTCAGQSTVHPLDDDDRACRNPEFVATPRQRVRQVFELAAAIEALADTVERQRATIDRLSSAIRDIDSHATPLAEDEDGYAAMGYVVAVGAIHRALGLAMGTGVPCAMCGPESHDCPGLSLPASTPGEPTT